MTWINGKRGDMEPKKRRQVVISKEDAVFWMDENGQWHNEHGKFEHPRIIKYFNASIKKDDQGYFVFQSTDMVDEKVYFKYKETAVFAVDLRAGKDLILALNVGKTVPFDPTGLYVKDDSLFMKTKSHLIKFTPQAMVKLSRYLKEKDGQLIFSFNEKEWPIN